MNTQFEILGATVSVTDIIMQRAAGYGQYSIVIDVEYEGKKESIKVHSTNSQLWDDLQDVEGDKSEWLLSQQKYLVEREIEDYISSL